jgi:hypothetical protein
MVVGFGDFAYVAVAGVAQPKQVLPAAPPTAQLEIPAATSGTYQAGAGAGAGFSYLI